ncbi:MAG: DNA polymerase III subunit delta, partial [Pseudomonadota bacterium]
MVAVKANQADAFLKKLPADVALIVAFGTDPGRVSEVAGTAAKAAAARSEPPAEILRIDDADLEDAPDRLMVELNTVPMFGGAKVIRTTLGRRVTSASLKPLLDGPPPPATLVVEAGNLKPTDALRKSADKLAWAASLACYADTDRSVADLITSIVSDAGQTIAPDARNALVARLGADRALSRNEIEKLTLYATGRPEITVADVDAIVGDASALSLDRINLAVTSGARGRAL